LSLNIKANPSTLGAMAGNKIQLKTGNELIFIAQDEIIAVMAENIYCVFLLKDNKKVKTALSLSAAMQLLDAKYFYKIHRSYIININAIERIDLATATVQLQYSTKFSPLPVSRKRHF
jgi:DNA-binding LytR/AlgR family response regulator